MRKPKKDWFNLNTLPVRLKENCECRIAFGRTVCSDCCIEKDSWSVPEESGYRGSPLTRKSSWYYRDLKTRILTPRDLLFLEGKEESFTRKPRPRYRRRFRPYDRQGFNQTQRTSYHQ